MGSADSAGATHTFAAALRARGIGFSLGLSVDQNLQQAILATPERAWLSAYSGAAGADADPGTVMRRSASPLSAASVIQSMTRTTRTRCANPDEFAEPMTPARPTNEAIPLRTE